MELSVGRHLKQDNPYKAASARLGTTVRKYRQQLSWSQQRLADQAGVSYATIRALETGVTQDPGVFTLLALADALQVPLADLVTTLDTG